MVTIELVPFGSGTNLTIPNDDITNLSADRTHTGVGTFRVSVKGDRELEDRAQRQDRINVKVDGDTKFTGILYDCAQNKATGTTELSGKGIAKILQENRLGGPDTADNVTYTNEFVGDAIEDYWSRTQFDNVTVTKQSANTLGSEQVQSVDTTTEWGNAVDLSGNPPVFVENGRLKLAQTGFVAEAEATGGVDATDVNYSGGEAATIEGAGSDEITLTFENEYIIREGDGVFYVRSQTGSSTGTPATCNVLLDGTTILNDFIISGDTTLEWNSVFDTYNVNIEKDLQPGTHTVTIEFANANDNVEQIFDVLAFVDGRYFYNFDNQVDEDNGYLDGPELYPPDLNPQIQTSSVKLSRNIAEATVSATYNDTSNGQQLGASNNNGGSFIRQSNTNSFTADFSVAGRELITEFTLSGVTGTERDATPQFNYQGQEIDSFATDVTLDDRIVLVGFEVSKNHFKNLQQLHEKGDFVWTIDHTNESFSNIPVFSFPRGGKTRQLPDVADNEIDETPEVSGGQYYNTIPVQGRKDSNGNRPFAEEEASQAVSDDGRAISPGLLRDLDIETDIGARYRARALLRKALKNGELRGQKTIPATFDVLPGFAYPVSWLDDDPTEITLEEISVQKSTDNATTTLDFVNRTGFARDIDELRRKARETEDRL
jgi:hypothetical protein